MNSTTTPPMTIMKTFRCCGSSMTFLNLPTAPCRPIPAPPMSCDCTHHGKTGVAYGQTVLCRAHMVQHNPATSRCRMNRIGR